MIFYQGGPIYHVTHVPGQIPQSSAEIEYNVACTAGMASAHFRMLFHGFLVKYTDIVPEEDHPIILYRKSDVYMANNGRDIKHTRHIARRVHF